MRSRPWQYLELQAGEERYYKSTTDAWSKIYHDEGPAAFFKVKPGSSPTLWLRPPTSGMGLTRPAPAYDKYATMSQQR